VNSSTGLALRYGIIKRNGDTILPCEYEVVHLAEDGLGYVCRNKETMHFRIENEEVSWIYHREDGSKETLPNWAAEWAAVVPLETQPKSYLGCWPDSQQQNKWAMLDANGNVIHSGALSHIESFSEGIALISRDGRWGYMRNDGVLIAQPQFPYAEHFTDGCALVQVGNDYNFIDTSGQYLCDTPLTYAYSFENGYAKVSVKDCGAGLINTRGEFVLPAEYNYIGSVAEDKTVSAEKGGEEYLFRLSESGAEEIKEVSGDLVLEDYMPFTGSKVAKLSGEPTLEKRASADHSHPRLDGATALFPVYSAIVEAVYPDETRYQENYNSQTLVTCTKTNKAYDRLIAGETDIIFCAEPSDAQIAVAKAAEVEFKLTPFGKESFVFIVNKDNPLDNITVEQIQKIYSGEISTWDELGVESLGDIIAYQRPDNSGSQTALQRLMGDVPLMRAPAAVLWRRRRRSLRASPSGVELTSRISSAGLSLFGFTAIPVHLLEKPRRQLDEVDCPVRVGGQARGDHVLDVAPGQGAASALAEQVEKRLRRQGRRVYPVGHRSFLLFYRKMLGIS